MGLIKEISSSLSEIKKWRHKIHSNPETAFKEFQTSAFVEEKLKSFGLIIWLAQTRLRGN